MEKRKETISALKMCRFCLTQEVGLSSLYDGNQKTNKSVSLHLKILSCLAVEVFPSDKMCTYICNRCNLFMDMFYEFKQICRRADERILQYIQNGEALETLTWPESLTKVFRYAYKNTRKPHVVKTVVEGGATVQVTSQDNSNSDEDEDEENIFNIKIGGTGDDSKCIKVVTAKNDTDIKTANKANTKDNSELMGRKIEEGCWPCDECERTYSLQQLLELHKKQKHRERNVNCDKCDAKFFSKYDLLAHSWRHSNEMPFQCVACKRKFKRLVLLKRHEKLVHPDIPQLPCRNCPAKFMSIEELNEHEKKHVRFSERAHACLDCDKKFHEKTSLLRHMDLVHYKKPDFQCEYCPQQFTSISKLARHVRSHATERPHPCKYCDKSFLKSHHFTRHLRLKHRDMLRSNRGLLGAVGDSYRCEQCDETFNTQDELIYHSAIHATQNLTCPLCQEKFDDVEAVTAHIKSHVNGMEFMCDLCELVFTTKEKLDNHLTAAHADEISLDMGQDDSSMDLDDEEDEDDNGINLKEENGEMVVEIKKNSDFLTQVESEGKPEQTISDDSEAEITYTELATVDTLAMIHKEPKINADAEKSVPEATKPPAAPVIVAAVPSALVLNTDNQTASILRKAEEIKRKVQQSTVEVTQKKVKTVKAESSTVGGASDKSLRLLEKELQELKRTNTRNEATKTPAKPVETLRNRRPQLYTSTPKTRATEEKKGLMVNKAPIPEKKVLERRMVTKENKELKENKEMKQNVTAIKEEKEVKEKEVKEKEAPKNVIKNGTTEKTQSEETVRRSTRPSKIKDYAKLIRDRSQDSSEDEDSDDADYDESKESEKEVIPKFRRSSLKPVAPAAKSPAAATPTVTTPPVRKRGRPRKDAKEVPAKVKKNEVQEDSDLIQADKSEVEETDNKINKNSAEEVEKEIEGSAQEIRTPNVTEKAEVETSKATNEEQKTVGGQLMSPMGQTLKKVPIKAIPPGIKPLPLPMRPMGTGELCEMQIGKKVVKVQKIVMTKAEVEAMAKKGLVEMKDGTMVLKQGIKLSSSDSLKTTLIGDKDAKESPIKGDKSGASQRSAKESI